MGKVKSFLKKKDIVFSVERYLIDALSAMTMGLFASMVVGLIIKVLGEQLTGIFGDYAILQFLTECGAGATAMLGPAAAVAIAYGLKAPTLVLFANVAVGMVGAELGGPVGAFVAAVVATEFGKLVSKETKIDIIVTPAVTIIVGTAVAVLMGPFVDTLMKGLGQSIMWATEQQPLIMGILVSVIMGLVLTSPISSAALAIMMGLGGLAGGAATIGCTAQMVGFAIMSLRDNGISGLFSHGLGTSMLQMPNIIKNPWILLPPTLASAIVGPIATVFFKMQNIPTGSGMGSSGLVGQIGTFEAMGFTLPVLIKILVLHFALPIIITFIFAVILRKKGLIKNGDLKLIDQK